MMGALHHNENYSCGNILFPYPDGLEMQLQMPDEGQPAKISKSGYCQILSIKLTYETVVFLYLKQQTNISFVVPH
jgi:hypothetical protein